jgi:hypothetical protein
MATPTISHAAHKPTEKIERANNALFEERWHEFRCDRALRLWYVPSATVEGRSYAVRLKPAQRCESRAFEYREGPCKHILSLKLFKAKTTGCSCCGERVLWRFVTEVMEEHELLAWFPGDRICADCIRSRVWA